MLHFFFWMMFHSSSRCLVVYYFCLLIHVVKTFFLSPDVIVTQAALGGTLTVLEPVAAGFCTDRGECVYCLCMHVSVSHCSRWGSKSVYLHGRISHDNCGQNIVSVRECVLKDVASTPLSCACNLCKRCVCFFSLHFYRVIRKQCSLFSILAKS